MFLNPAACEIKETILDYKCKNGKLLKLVVSDTKMKNIFSVLDYESNKLTDLLSVVYNEDFSFIPSQLSRRIINYAKTIFAAVNWKEYINSYHITRNLNKSRWDYLRNESASIRETISKAEKDAYEVISKPSRFMPVKKIIHIKPIPEYNEVSLVLRMLIKLELNNYAMLVLSAMMLNPEYSEMFHDNISKFIQLLPFYNYYMSYSLIHLTWFECAGRGKNFCNGAHTIFTKFTGNMFDNPYILVNGPFSQATSAVFMHLAGSREFISAEKFQWRLTYILGKALGGICLSDYKASVTGSILIPCVVTSPLEKKTFSLFIEKYYPSLRSINIKSKSDKESTADVDIPISCSVKEFDNLATSLINHISKNITTTITKVQTKSVYKYVIHSDQYDRLIEIFPVYKQHQTLTRGFHYPCVRMYYSGYIAKGSSDIKNTFNGLSLSPTCVAALLSGVMCDKKWISCNKNPIETAIKYAKRGYSIMMNEVEIEVFLKVTGHQRNMFGSFTSAHPFFGASLPESTSEAFVYKKLSKQDTPTKTINSIFLPTLDLVLDSC